MIKFTVPNVPGYRDLRLPLSDILDSKILTRGKYLEDFKEKIHQMYDVKHVIPCGSCSQGLLMAVRAIKNDLKNMRVTVPSFTWESTQLAGILNSMKIDYKDVDVSTFNILRDDYNFVIPVHCFGNICEIEGKHVIYDAAHALGCKIKDFGDITVFSTSATKMITSCEGGVIITDSNKYAENIRNMEDKFSRMSEFHALIGLKSLKMYEKNLRLKKQIVGKYKHILRKIMGNYIKYQRIPIDTNWYVFSILTEDYIRAEIQKKFKKNKIEYKQYFRPLVDTPNAIYLRKNILCLPSYPSINDEDINKIIMIIRESFYNAGGD